MADEKKVSGKHKVPLPDNAIHYIYMYIGVCISVAVFVPLVQQQTPRG